MTHVEMEAGGAYRAARETRRGHEYRLLCVRGISDVVGFRRESDWTRFACQTAASFVLALIKSDVAFLSRREAVLEAGGTAGSPPSTARHSTASQVDEIRHLVDDCLRTDNRMFAQAVRNAVAGFRQDVQAWKEVRAIRMPTDDRGRFLVKLYMAAKRAVFSTRLKVFTGTFRGSPLPDDILHAHREANVPITRVFIFEEAADVNGFDYREMRRQLAAGVDVRVYFQGSKPAEPIPDFTIIDNTAVGVTTFVGPRDAAGNWVFGEPADLQPHLRLRDRMLRDSISVPALEAQENRLPSLWQVRTLVDVSDFNADQYQRLSAQFFGADIADREAVLGLQRRAGAGIFILEETVGANIKAVGLLALIPVARRAFRLLEANSLKGSGFTPADVLAHGEGPPVAYYLGAIGGIGRWARAAVLDALTNHVRELDRQGVESVFARPVTEDGLRLLRRMRFQGPSGQPEPVMNAVCRLRLGDPVAEPAGVL